MSTGNIVLLAPADQQSTSERNAQDIKSKVNSFQASVIVAQNELRAGKERMHASLVDEELSLFDAYIFMLESNRLPNGILARIRNRQWVHGALRDTIFEMSRVFEQMDVPYSAARAGDIRNIGRQVLSIYINPRR